MKLTLIAHPVLSGANEMLLSSIKNADIGNLSENYLLVVPDRYTLNAEKELLSLLGTCLNVQVTTLRRLSSRLAPVNSNYVSSDKCLLILTKLLSENKSSLKILLTGGITYGLVKSLLDVINQLRYSLVKPQDIQPEKLPERLRGKIGDIRLVYEKYLEYLSQGYADSADKLTSLFDVIPYSPLVAKSHFYFKDFDNFSAQELSIVEKLILHAKSVTVSCTYSGEESHACLYDNEVFDSVRQTAEKLVNKQKLKPDNFDIIFGNVPDEETAFMQKYFLSALIPEKPRVLPEKFSLYNGASPTDEVEGLAKYVSEMISNGYRPDDFTVIMSDKSTYFQPVNAIFSLYGIPYYIERKTSLFDTPLGQFVTSFIRLSEENRPTVDRITSFTENFYFSAQKEDKCAFGNYIRKYNCKITDKPFIYGKDSPWYEQAETVRAQYVTLFKERLPENAPTSVYTQAIRTLLSDANVDERTLLLSEMLTKEELFSASLHSEQVSRKLIEILDSVDEILGETMLGFRVFSDILSSAMESADLSLIPLTGNCVEFIEMAKARRHNYRHVAVLGANDEVFPIVKSDSRLLSDENLEVLALAGADIRPSVKTLNKREKFDIYQLFLEPCETFRVSYASVIPVGGTELLPSVCVKTLRRIFCDENGLALRAETRFDCRHENYPNKTAASHALKEKISDHFSAGLPLSYASPLYYMLGCPPVSELIAPPQAEYVTLPEKAEKQLSSMSASRIESFYSCPYRYYLRYVMNLVPKDEDEDITATIIGNIVHAVLEKGLLPFTRNPDYSETPEETALRCGKIFDKTVQSDEYVKSFLEREKNAAILLKLKNECIATLTAAIKQIENSDFKPLYLEKKFDCVKVTTPFGTTKITGKIDRADVFQGKAIVIDYKTGGKTSAEFDEKDLYKGKKLQLTTYLTALKDEFDVVGIYYLRLSDGYLKNDEVPFCWSGITDSNTEIISHVDRHFSLTKESTKLRIFTKKDGELYSKSKVLSSEGFEKYEAYTLRMYENAIKACHEGFIAPTPVEKTCDFCDYERICPFFDTSASPKR